MSSPLEHMSIKKAGVSPFIIFLFLELNREQINCGIIIGRELHFSSSYIDPLPCCFDICLLSMVMIKHKLQPSFSKKPCLPFQVVLQSMVGMSEKKKQRRLRVRCKLLGNTKELSNLKKQTKKLFILNRNVMPRAFATLHDGCYREKSMKAYKALLYPSRVLYVYIVSKYLI